MPLLNDELDHPPGPGRLDQAAEAAGSLFGAWTTKAIAGMLFGIGLGCGSASVVSVGVGLLILSTAISTTKRADQGRSSMIGHVGEAIGVGAMGAKSGLSGVSGITSIASFSNAGTTITTLISTLPAPVYAITLDRYGSFFERR